MDTAAHGMKTAAGRFAVSTERAGLIFSRGCARSADIGMLQGIFAGIGSDVVRRNEVLPGACFRINSAASQVFCAAGLNLGTPAF